MKFATIAVMSIFPMCYAFADQPYPHSYENGGYFAAEAPAEEKVQPEVAYPHEYHNGGHFEVAPSEASKLHAKDD